MVKTIRKIKIALQKKAQSLCSLILHLWWKMLRENVWKRASWEGQIPSMSFLWVPGRSVKSSSRNQYAQGLYLDLIVHFFWIGLGLVILFPDHFLHKYFIMIDSFSLLLIRKEPIRIVYCNSLRLTSCGCFSYDAFCPNLGKTGITLGLNSYCTSSLCYWGCISHTILKIIQ